MKRALVVVAVAVVIIIAARSYCGSTDRGAGSAEQPRGGVADRGRVSGTNRAPIIPSWLIQPGVASRRIAGRVEFEGDPVPGALVSLAVEVTDDTLQPVAEQRADGGLFDFGLQPAANFRVSAEAPGRTSAAVSISVADPAATASAIVLKLRGCTSRMFGFVQDSSRGPIVGARLTTTGVGGTTSAANGSYNLCLTPIRMRVRVDADGYGSVESRKVELSGALRYDFVLVPEAELAGRVVDDRAAPVANAQVIATPDNADRALQLAGTMAVTDTDGRYRFERLAPGRYRLSATGDGLATSESLFVLARPAPALGDTNLVLSRMMRLRGRLVMAHEPVVGARVTATRNQLAVGSSGYSQADGSFVLSNIPVGVIEFSVRPFEVLSPTSYSVQPAARGSGAEGSTTDEVTIEVAKLSTIQGRVTHQSKAVVDADILYNRRVVTRSDNEGRFVLHGLSPGEVMFSVVHQAYKTAETRVQLAAGEDKSVNVELDVAGAAMGVIVDELGKPVPGVYMRMEITNGSLYYCDALADDNGRFNCKVPAGGEYRMLVFPSPMAVRAFALVGRQDAPKIEIPPNATISDIVIAIEHHQLAISGTVTNETGMPMADVRVEAIGRRDGFVDLPSKVTDADGRFEITNLARGAYKLYARAPDGRSAEVTDVASGSDEVSITLVRPGAIEGTLVGFSKPPTIELVGMVAGSRVTALANVDGARFWQKGLQPGHYAIQARSGTDFDGTEVDVVSGQTALATLRSRGVGKIEGETLEHGTGTALAGTRCEGSLLIGGSATFGSADSPIQATSDARGKFSMLAPVGKVRVSCISPDPGLSIAGADVEVAAQAPANARVFAVRKTFGATRGYAGFTLRSFVLPLTLDGVDPAGGAAAQGLRPGDQLVAIDGVPVDGLLPMGAMFLVWNHRPGTVVELMIARAGGMLSFKVPVVAGK